MRGEACVLVLNETSSPSAALLMPASRGFRVQCVSRFSSALARIAGGGVNAVVLDLSSMLSEDDKLSSFFRLRRAAPDVPLAVVCDSNDSRLLSLMARTGASATLAREDCPSRLPDALRRLVDGPVAGTEALSSGSPLNKARVVTFLGSKGGVGSTTVASNVACELAHSGRVVLAELRPGLGSLSQLLRPLHEIRDLAALLKSEIDAGAIEGCLWRHGTMLRLRVLFGSQQACPEVRIEAGTARKIVTALTTLADYVVLDVAPGLSEANRCIIESSDCLAMVVDREPVSLEAARKVLRAILSWQSAPASVGCIIVNRAPFVTPVSLDEIDAKLRVPVLGLIPPAPDDCLAAQRAGRPLVSFDEDCLAANALAALARTLRSAEAIRPPAMPLVS